MTPLLRPTEDEPRRPHQDPLWCQGWYRFAAHQASPNFGPRPQQARIDLVVLHSISLPPGKYGGPQVQQFFSNQLDWQEHPYFSQIKGLQVSAHFFIRRNGELWQLVSCDDRAWHAGASSYRGRSNCNDDSIGIELEGLEGGLFEDAQYECLQSVCAALMQHYPIAHLAGHEHIAPGRKADPGAGFDWLQLQKNLGLDDQYLPVVVVSQTTGKGR
jgi:N-acetyl-anhydromuramoyl-L-alanine amidase